MKAIHPYARVDLTNGPEHALKCGAKLRDLYAALALSVANQQMARLILVNLEPKTKTTMRVTEVVR